jgi:hypothetical protein
MKQKRIIIEVWEAICLHSAAEWLQPDPYGSGLVKKPPTSFKNPHEYVSIRVFANTVGELGKFDIIELVIERYPLTQEFRTAYLKRNGWILAFISESEIELNLRKLSLINTREGLEYY